MKYIHFNKALYYCIERILLSLVGIGVRVRTEKRTKKGMAFLAHREAVEGLENIRTVHEPKPIQTAATP